jgi:hypothetical protein
MACSGTAFYTLDKFRVHAKSTGCNKRWRLHLNFAPQEKETGNCNKITAIKNQTATEKGSISL